MNPCGAADIYLCERVGVEGGRLHEGAGCLHQPRRPLRLRRRLAHLQPLLLLLFLVAPAAVLTTKVMSSSVLFNLKMVSFAQFVFIQSSWF